jgi:hypothetical protein
MLTKNNIESIKNTVTKKDLENLVAEKDKEVLETDFFNDVFQTLKEKYNEETKDKPMTFSDWIRSKPGNYFKRLTYNDGGKVVDFLSYAKMKKPKVKEINLAQGDFEKTVADVTPEDREVIKQLLRLSGINVGGSND